MRLEDRVAVVTGGSSGIGAAVVRRFAEEGATVVAGARSEEALRALASESRSTSWRRLDVTDEASVRDFAEHVRREHGRVDVLVSNAGVARFGSVADAPVEDFDELISTNLRGAFLVAKAFLPLMLPERPWPRTMIHTASVAGTSGMAGLSGYCASKFGLRGLSQSLAAEVAPSGLRVVAVNPGFVATPMTEGAPASPEDMIRPDELAEVYLHLATLPPSMQIEEVTVWPQRLFTE